MAGGQWLHHFGRIAIECADVGSDIKIDSMKVLSAIYVYYTYFKITGDPCNLIGSQ